MAPMKMPPKVSHVKVENCCLHVLQSLLSYWERSLLRVENVTFESAPPKIVVLSNVRFCLHLSYVNLCISFIVVGFDWRIGVKHGRIWGEGIYLSPHPDFAMAYSNTKQGKMVQAFLKSQHDLQNIQPPHHLMHREYIEVKKLLRNGKVGTTCCW